MLRSIRNESGSLPSHTHGVHQVEFEKSKCASFLADPTPPPSIEAVNARQQNGSLGQSPKDISEKMQAYSRPRTDQPGETNSNTWNIVVITTVLVSVC